MEYLGNWDGVKDRPGALWPFYVAAKRTEHPVSFNRGRIMVRSTLLALLACSFLSLFVLPSGTFGTDPKSPSGEPKHEAIAIRPIVSQVSFTGVKYGSQISDQEFYNGIGKALDILKEKDTRIGNLELELSARLILNGEQKAEFDYVARSEEISKWLSGDGKTERRVAQVTIDDLPEISGTLKSDGDALRAYKGRLDMAAKLQCRSAVVYIEQQAPPAEIDIIVSHMQVLCAHVAEQSKGKTVILIEPKRARSSGIHSLVQVIRKLREKDKKADIGISLNLSAIPDETGYIWETDLSPFVRCVAIETYRFVESGGFRESNRDYQKIISQYLANESKRPTPKPDATKDKGASSPHRARSAFSGDVVVRYLGKEYYMDGLRNSLRVVPITAKPK